MKKLLIAITLITCIYLLCACEGKIDTKVAYELQESCAKKAEQAMKNEYPLQRTYESHHNLKLNKCIIRVLNIGIDPSWKTTCTDEWLFDANERKKYGEYYYCSDRPDIPFGGNIEGKDCKNLQEWQSFVKKMMTE